MSVFALDTRFVDHVVLARVGSYLSLVTGPGAGNPNLCAQAGLFTLWQSELTTVEQVIEELQTQLAALQPPRPWNGKLLIRHDLPWPEAPRLLRLLALEQIDAARMFPGYPGVVAAMRERTLWKS